MTVKYARYMIKANISRNQPDAGICLSRVNATKYQ